MAYLVKGPTYGNFQKQTLSGVNGTTTSWTLDFAVGSASSILVSHGGVIQEPNVAYTVSNGGRTINFSEAPVENTYLLYLGKQYLVPTQQGYEVALEQFTGTGAQTVFTLTSNPVVNSGLIVYVDGIQQSHGTLKNFTLAGLNVVFTSPPVSGAEIDIYVLARERVAYDTVSDGVLTYLKFHQTIRGSVGEWVVVSTNTNMVAGKWYMVDTLSGAKNLTLPASPFLGDTFKVSDYSGTFATNNCTILRNGQKINGVSEDLILNLNFGDIELRYTGTTNGWRVIV